MHPFDEATAYTFKRLYDSLGEKDSRRLAGSLYQLSNSLKYVCDLLNVSHKTVQKGLAELKGEATLISTRQRREGGGRPTKWDCPQLNAVFTEVIKPYLAGDPTDPSVRWTNLSLSEIADLLEAQGFKVCPSTVRKLLDHNGFKKRKIQKRKSLKSVEDRDTQFDEINTAITAFMNDGEPVVSVDTKKKSP